MKTVSILLKIMGALMLVAGVVHFLFGLTYLHFFSASVTMGIVPRDRMPVLICVLVFSAASSVAILAAGLVTAINSAEPLKARNIVCAAACALVLGIVSEIFVRVVGYESSLIYTASGILVPFLDLAAAVLFLVLALKGYRLHGQRRAKKP